MATRWWQRTVGSIEQAAWGSVFTEGIRLMIPSLVVAATHAAAERLIQTYVNVVAWTTALVVALIISIITSKKGTLTSLPIKLKFARYQCAQDNQIFNDQTDKVKGMISGSILTVEPSDEAFGDPCKNHVPFIEGHGKSLEISYSCQSIKSLPRGVKHTIVTQEDWKQERL